MSPWERDAIVGRKAPWEQDALAGDAPSMAEDILKSTGTGLVRGITGLAGSPGDIRDIIGAGVQWAGRKMGFEPGAIPEGVQPGFVDIAPPTSAEIVSGVENVTGPLYTPQTTAGKYAETIGEFAPAAFVGPGSFARKAVTQAVLPAVGSEAAGQATEGTALEPWARVGGAVAGGAVPGMLRRAVTPLPIAPERQAMIDVLRREGVRPTAGQATGRKGLQYFESEMGGGATARAIEQQQDDFTRAALRRVGENADRATPEVIDRAFSRIGQQFDDLAARNVLRPDPRFGQEVGQVLRDYAAVVPPSRQAPVVGDFATDIISRLQQGQGAIPGGVYQTYRSRLDKMARAARNDPQLSDALFGIRNALDDAMERSIAASGNPADIAAWREARNQYRNMLVVEKAATGAGEASAMGSISPAKLRGATVAQNRRAYARGRGNFADLARAGESVLSPLPQSGTAPRLAARGLPAFVGGIAGGAASGGPGAGIGMALGAAAPHVVGRAAMTRPVQSYLANQLMAGGNISEDTRRALLAEALLDSRFRQALLPSQAP